MLTYQYIARNTATGQRVKAIVEAQSEHDAAKLLHDQGLVAIDIKLVNQHSLGALTKRISHVKAKDRVLFARQLSTLINAGLPLVQALRSVAEQTASKPLKVIVNQLIRDVEGGATLSSALKKHPRAFNQVFISLVLAGEASGTLDTALDRLAIQQERDADTISKIRGAMIYPIVVVFVMIAVVVFMLVKVLPQVQLLYTSFPGANLPVETRVLLSLSHFITHDWWIVVVLVGGIGFALWRWFKTKTGRRVLDTLKLNLPPFSVLFRKVYMARFARTASTLVAAGVPLLQVLEITSDAVANVRIQESIKKASEKVKGGKSLGDSLQGDPQFLPLVPSMLKIGEQSGAMEDMLRKAAEYYEKEVEDAIKSISSIIEPVMMVLLGVVALIIVAAVLLPVYNLAGSGAISSGGA